MPTRREEAIDAPSCPASAASSPPAPGVAPRPLNAVAFGNQATISLQSSFHPARGSALGAASLPREEEDAAEDGEEKDPRGGARRRWKRACARSWRPRTRRAVCSASAVRSPVFPPPSRRGGSLRPCCPATTFVSLVSCPPLARFAPAPLPPHPLLSLTTLCSARFHESSGEAVFSPCAGAAPTTLGESVYLAPITTHREGCARGVPGLLGANQPPFQRTSV